MNSFMHISQERYGDALVLALAGRIDNSTTEGLKTGLDSYVAACRSEGDKLILDFSKVEYISSVGLRVLMLAAKQSREQGGTIVVAALQPVVREIFEISRFNLVFECLGSVREALAKISPTGLIAYDAKRGD
jgi:anti-anti-sigma factor